MRYSPQHSEDTRQRVLDAAARQFRKHGFGGVGVDALAKGAGVTSGAFYSHFASKAEAFRMIAAGGLERLRLGIEHLRAEHGKAWLGAFATFYLGPAHRRDVAGGCAMPSLSAEVARADRATRVAYQAELVKVADAVAAGLPGKVGRDGAWPVLAQIAGGLLLARAVHDEALAREISAAVLEAVRKCR